MKLEIQIFRDLSAGQATASAMEETLQVPVAVLEPILQRLVKTGKLTTGTIMGCLTVYRLQTKSTP